MRVPLALAAALLILLPASASAAGSLTHPPGPPPDHCAPITIDGRHYGNIISHTLTCHAAHEWIRGFHTHRDRCGFYTWKDCGFGEPPGSVQCMKTYVSGIYDVQCRHHHKSVTFRYSPRSAGGGL